MVAQISSSRCGDRGSSLANMALIAPRIKDSDLALRPASDSRSVTHLDIEIVAAALIRHDANVRNAARALNVPSGDLRKLVLVDQRLADAALEAVELRLDDAEANLCEALHCDDPRRRDSVSMFMLRNVQRAAKRGYAVAASAASLEVSVGDRAQPQRIVFSWRDSSGDRDREMETIERNGERIEVPRYGDGCTDDCFDGELTTPAALIEHDAEPEPVIAEPVAPEPTLPVWSGPYGPPPLVQHLYQPWTPPPRVAPARPRG